MRRMRDQRWTRLATRLMLCALGLTTACAGNAARPNVLLITIDTLRADHLGCYGYGRRTSPRVDRLAAEGALFERAYTSLPRTTQSIASILTGRFPKGHGARGLFSRLPEANVTLAEILKEHGYATAAFTTNSFLRPGQGFEQGFDLYDNPESRWVGDSAVPLTRAAVTWLQSRPAGTPWFLWVHYLDPHWTYEPGEPFDTAFTRPLDRPFTLYGDLAAGRLTKGQVIFENRLDADAVDHVIALYDGEIAQVDAALGPLLDAAASAGSPPLIMLTSDHGESLGEQGYFFAHGEYLYEPTLRIPLIASLPERIPPGLRAPGLAHNVDIAPTILALLGINRMQSVDGRPLLMAADDAADGSRWVRPAPGRDLVFAESDFQLIHPENPRYYIPGPSGRWSSASDGRFKVIGIPRPGGDRLERYDLQEDPGETRNLDGSDIGRAAASRLLQELLLFVDYDGGIGPVTPRDIAPEERERLRSLGYVN